VTPGGERRNELRVQPDGERRLGVEQRGGGPGTGDDEVVCDGGPPDGTGKGLNSNS
jgi:hypothetical protein